jgi:hypothetical protein
MKSIKINFKSQLQNWNDFFLQIIILIPFASYSYYKYRIDMVLYPFYVLITVDFIFTLYLHIVYYLKNKGQEFLISEDRIERIKNGKKEVFHTSDIDKIVICKSANMDKWGIPYTTFESFRVARIYLNNGTYFIMTNLLEYDLEKPLSIVKNVKFERRKGFSFFI